MEGIMSQSNAARATSDDADQPQTSARRPVDTAKVGNVEIAIWKNHNERGDFYTAGAPSLRYKDGEQWKEGSSYGAIDLLALAEAAREASAKIRDLSKGRVQGR
jgi:hypothetical protein